MSVSLATPRIELKSQASYRAVEQFDGAADCYSCNTGECVQLFFTPAQTLDGEGSNLSHMGWRERWTSSQQPGL